MLSEPEVRKTETIEAFKNLGEAVGNVVVCLHKAFLPDAISQGTNELVWEHGNLRQREAAAYHGIGRTKFGELKIPPAGYIGRIPFWKKADLDKGFKAETRRQKKKLKQR